LLRQNRPADVIDLLARKPGIAGGTDAAIKQDVLSGLAHFRLDQAGASSRELERAHQLAEATHSSLLAEVLRAEGLIARDSDQDELALTKFRASLAAVRDGGELVKAADLVDIGFFSLRQRHFADAVTESQRAVDYARSVGAGRQLELALGNVGWAYQNLGDFETALTNFEAAEREAAAIGRTTDQVLWLLDAGLAQYRLGNLDAARQLYERALRTDMTLPPDKEVDQLANIQSNLALLLSEQGQIAAARRYSDAAIAAAAKSKDNIVIAYARSVQGRLVGGAAGRTILSAAWPISEDPDIRAEIESAMAHSHAEDQQIDQADLWYRRSIATFETKRAAVSDLRSRLSAFGYGQAIYRGYAEFLIKTSHSQEALQLLDRSRSRTLEEGLNLNEQQTSRPEAPVLGPERIAGNLNATILFYSLGPTQSRLWAVTAKQTQLFTLPAEQEIQALVRQHQRDIQQALDPASSALYDALVKPAAALIGPGTKVFVIADGVLHGLNFETLVTQTTGGTHYWIEDVAVTAASSIRMLSHWGAATAPKAARDLLLIGDPTLPRGEFAPLPDAANEMQQVRQHFQPGGQIVLARNAAVPAAYAASNPGDFRYIHLATHGTASRLSPLESAVVLSPPPQHPDDFKLYARDIVQLPLHATLVTISACYGSGIRTYAGEGLVGLAWVFLRAGAHNVIAALWQVADSASPQLMNQLYSELQAGKAPDEALRAAKLSLLHSSRAYRKPLFWGAFQLYAGS
jgi:CHAT domain-containing protein